MKKNKLPVNRLDIITPVLDAHTLNLLTKAAHEYPELEQSVYSKQVDDPIAERIREIEMYPVTGKSPLAAKGAVEILAYYFRREFEYAFPPYEAVEPLHMKDRLFLWTDKSWGTEWGGQHTIGSIGFRWREWRDAPAGLALAWVWLHPFRRGRGILSAYWDLFRQWYGDFYIEPPLSKAMQSFLRKRAVLRATMP